MKIGILFIVIFSFVACNTKEEKKDNPQMSDTLSIVENDYLKNTSWSINLLLGLDSLQSNYILYKPRVEQDIWDAYGDFVYFTDSSTFISYYSAPCGNDCFRTVYGKYKLYSGDFIELNVDSVSYDGDCWVPTEYRNGKKLMYSIESNDSIISLKKNNGF